MDLRLETFLPYRLNRAAAMSSRPFSHIYRHEFGLTVPEWRVPATPRPRAPPSATGTARESPMPTHTAPPAAPPPAPRRWVPARIRRGHRTPHPPPPTPPRTAHHP